MLFVEKFFVAWVRQYVRCFFEILVKQILARNEEKVHGLAVSMAQLSVVGQTK